MPDVVSIVISFVSGSIGGSITGATVAHFLAKRREGKAREHTAQSERESRKQDFLRGWRIDAVMDNNPRITAGKFSEKVRLFEEAAERITNDYGAPFEDLVKRVSSMGNSYVEQPHGHNKLIQAMDAVRDFVKAN